MVMVVMVFSDVHQAKYFSYSYQDKQHHILKE